MTQEVIKRGDRRGVEYKIVRQDDDTHGTSHKVFVADKICTTIEMLEVDGWEINMTPAEIGTLYAEAVVDGLDLATITDERPD